MNNAYFDLLMWSRTTGFDIALTVMVAGMLLRVVEIIVLGRKKDFSKAKGNPVAQGIKTIFTRSVARKGMVKQAPITYWAGYVFHIGFFVAFLFFGAHIALVEELLGIGWPEFNRAVIETASALALVAAAALAYTRITDPVRRSLTGWGDWFVLIVSVLPLMTGYMAVNKLFGVDGQLWMAIHILTAEFLMISFPFTKLMHAVTFAMARYYNGSIQGRKGAES